MLNVKDFARDSGSENSQDREEDTNETEPIPGTSRENSEQLAEPPPFQAQAFFPNLLQDNVINDPTIEARYGGQTEDNNSQELMAMELLGLPTSLSNEPTRDRPKKVQKKTFFCNACNVDLSSEDTRDSHVRGVKHQKRVRTLAEQQRHDGALDNVIIAVPNPESSKKKIVKRVQESIRETSSPVIGLKHVREFLAASNPEMEPYYHCKLCGNKGNSNGMFNHVTGSRHRNSVLYERFPDLKSPPDPNEMERLAVKFAENNDKLSDLIRTIQDDNQYPWPPGKAPWALENGGTGVAPNEAKENIGKYKIDPESKDSIPPHTKYSEDGLLPCPDRLRAPVTMEDKDRYLVLAHKLIQLVAGKTEGELMERFEKMADSVFFRIRKTQSIPENSYRNGAMKREPKLEDEDLAQPGPSGIRRIDSRMKTERNSRSISPLENGYHRDDHRDSTRKRKYDQYERSASPRGSRSSREKSYRHHSPPRRPEYSRRSRSPDFRDQRNGYRSPDREEYNRYREQRWYSPDDRHGRRY